jgi:hypothetical protein
MGSQRPSRICASDKLKKITEVILENLIIYAGRFRNWVCHLVARFSNFDATFDPLRHIELSMCTQSCLRDPTMKIHIFPFQIGNYAIDTIQLLEFASFW